MTMTSAPRPADRDQIRAAVAARYAGLARATRAGQAIADGDPDAPTGCSAGAYPDTGDLPAGAPSFAEYRAGLSVAGFTGITITPTHQVGDGVHAAIIRAFRP
jgi:hypothetical protein